MTGKSKPVLLGLFIIALVFSGFNINDSVRINLWSTYFVRYKFSGKSNPQTITPAPDNHQRYKKWIAREAIENGKPDKAIKIVERLAENNDTDAIMITPVIKGPISLVIVVITRFPTSACC